MRLRWWRKLATHQQVSKPQSQLISSKKSKTFALSPAKLRLTGTSPITTIKQSKKSLKKAIKLAGERGMISGNRYSRQQSRLPKTNLSPCKPTNRVCHKILSCQDLQIKRRRWLKNLKMWFRLLKKVQSLKIKRSFFRINWRQIMAK